MASIANGPICHGWRGRTTSSATSRRCSRNFSVSSAGRHRRGIHRHAQLAQHERQRADVVFVTVRDHEAEEAVAELLQVRQIGNDQVDAEHVQLGEHQAAIDGDGGVAVLEHQAIQPDLTEPAERNDTQHAAAVERRRSHTTDDTRDNDTRK